MRIHRFYVPPPIKLEHDFWLHDERLVYQWGRVLRMGPGQQLVLFDGIDHDRLYRLEEINSREAHLVHITDMVRQVPKRDVHLLWSVLKKDKNEWVLQKCTELGVSHFLPLLTERSEKLGFDMDRAQKIIIEAAEQCGRSDIPTVREPVRLETALEELESKITLYVCEQTVDQQDATPNDGDKLGVLIGPEGGWSDAEKSLFQERNISSLKLHDFTLRGETATIVAAAKLLQ